MPTPEPIAPSDTLLGLLQRGRGEGYRQALRAPPSEASDLLIQCITHDPLEDKIVRDAATFRLSQL